MTIPLPDELAQFVTVTDSGCWQWNGSTSDRGYGYVTWFGERARVHRLTYRILIGPIPEGLELDHLCRNKGCCHPLHLEPVTHAENMRRADVWGDYWEKSQCRHGHELAVVGIRETTNKRGYVVRSCAECCRDTVRRHRARLKETVT